MKDLQQVVGFMIESGQLDKASLESDWEKHAKNEQQKTALLALKDKQPNGEAAEGPALTKAQKKRLKDKAKQQAKKDQKKDKEPEPKKEEQVDS